MRLFEQLRKRGARWLLEARELGVENEYCAAAEDVSDMQRTLFSPTSASYP
jgi:hypothetical protein